MKLRGLFPVLTIAAAALAGCAQRGASTDAAGTAAEADALVIVSPTAPQLQSGCSATFFGDRNFSGDSLTLLVYEKQFLSARSVGFQPGSREAGRVEKLGFGGRIESMQLRCS